MGKNRPTPKNGFRRGTAGERPWKNRAAVEESKYKVTILHDKTRAAVKESEYKRTILHGKTRAAVEESKHKVTILHDKTARPWKKVRIK